MANDPVAFDFFTEIGIIAQLSQSRLQQALPGGLKLSHFTVLNHFARRGGEQSPAELARAFQVTKGAMTNTVQRLAARGLVAVRPDPRDGRAKLVSPTPAGCVDGKGIGTAPLVARRSDRVERGLNVIEEQDLVWQTFGPSLDARAIVGSDQD